MSTSRSTSGYTLFPNCSRKAQIERPLEVVSRKPFLASNSRPNSPRHFSRTSDGASPHRDRVRSSLALSDPSSQPVPERKCLRSTRLIPLKLSPTSDSERKSSIYLPSPAFISEPTKSTCRRTRLSVSTDLGHSLRSEKEWKTIMYEVKSLYLKEQYKHCSTRCKFLLDEMRNFPQSLLFHIYLSAYRASSLEMMAFNLPNYSTQKMRLYYEARASYEAAISQLQCASCSDLDSSSMLDFPSRLSSARSSIDSIFSQYSNTSSVMSMPPTSIESSQIRKENEIGHSEQRKKKKVSFSLSKDASTMWPNDDDDDDDDDDEMSYNPLSTSNSLLDFFPSPPSASCSPPVPMATKMSKSCLSKSWASLEHPPLAISTAQHHDILFPSTPSPNRLSHFLRYHNIVNSLCSQLILQKEGVQEIINRSSANIYIVGRPVPPSIESGAERTRRLRENKWSRKRFDGSRYQRLCESALSELHT